MFRPLIRVGPPGNHTESSGPNPALMMNFAGPLLRADALIFRYGSAIAVVLLAAALRLALTPVLGTQALLLPFVLAVLGTSMLAGTGPALLAVILAPLLATPVLMGWPNEVIPPGWWGHVVFFLVISTAVTHVMHSLQRATRVEQTTQIAMRQSEWEAQQSETQLRLMADALPFLIAYIDAGQRYRFANKEHKKWFDVEPETLIGRHAQTVWSDDYQMIRPHIEAALAGKAVDCEAGLPYRSGPSQIRMHLRPDFGLHGTVNGLFATIEACGKTA